MVKHFLKVNTVLIPYQLSVAFAMGMGMGSYNTNEEIFNNLYWIITYYILFASAANVVMVTYFIIKKRTEGLIRAFFLSETFVIAIHCTLILILLIA